MPRITTELAGSSPAGFIFRKDIMTTYSVICGGCGREMLFEQPEPMADPGQLSAFCSNDCSRKVGLSMMRPIVDAGHGIIVDLPCGCFALVYSAKENGATMPWMICESARGGFENWSKHSNEVHHEAVAIVRRSSCSHKNTTLIREGMTGMCGRVICTDCGYEREWNAY
jgi:hypothetical protein